MVTIKVEMAPEKEEAFRRVVGKHGGAMNAYVLPFLNAIADGTLVLTPQFVAPAAKKEAA
jgi:hypothetical protein